MNHCHVTTLRTIQFFFNLVNPLSAFCGVPNLGFCGVPNLGFCGVPTLGFCGVPTLGFCGVPTLGFCGVPTLGFCGVPTLGLTQVKAVSAAGCSTVWFVMYSRMDSPPPPLSLLWFLEPQMYIRLRSLADVTALHCGQACFEPWNEKTTVTSGFKVNFNRPSVFGK